MSSIRSILTRFYQRIKLSNFHTIIGSDNVLSPSRCQAIIWTNNGILLIGPLGTNFSEISIKAYTFSFRKMHLKMSSGKWQPFCLSLNVLMLHILIIQNPSWRHLSQFIYVMLLSKLRKVMTERAWETYNRAMHFSASLRKDLFSIYWVS